MKILKSYKKMMNEFIGEDDEREKLLKQKIKDKEHPDGVQVGTILKDPDRYDSNLVKKAQSVVDTGGDDASGDDGSSTKLSGPGDFSRDGGDAQSEPKADKPAKTKPEDFTNDLAGDEEAGQLANRLAQEYPEDDPEDIEKELTDMGHGDLAKAIRNADSLEDKAALISKATEAPDDDMSDDEERIESEIEKLNDKIQSMMNDMDPDTDEIMKLVKKKEDLEDKLYGESININGKQYRPIKESKKSKKHILKENYKRFFGDR